MSSSFNIMGIDQSFTSTGVVVMDNKKDVVVMDVIATSKTTDDKKEIFWRARSIVSSVLDTISSNNVGFVAIEQLAYGSVGDATRNLAGLQFMIINMLIDRDIPFITVPPTSLKKYATSKGNCGKQEMVDSLPHGIKEEIEKYPKTKGRYDLADAYWLASKGVDENEV